MGDAQQAERAAFAHQLMAIGRYTINRIDEQTDEHNFWVVDGWEQIAAEISAELGINRKRASSQMHYGQTLIERLPKLAEVFVAGAVDFRVIAAAIFRTDLITDHDALAAIDAQLAAKAPAWNRLSREKICELVDWMVLEADPEAIRVAKQRDLDRHIEVRPGPNGTAEIYGEVRGPDAAVFDGALDELAATVCPNDPRTSTQRRTDALTPLAARATSMPCMCGSPDCAAASTEVVSTPVVINVIAEAATVEGSSDKPGYLPGYGTVPAATVAEMAKSASLRAGTPAERPWRRIQLPAVGGVDPVRPVPRSDLHVPRLRSACDRLRYRPQRALPPRADPSIEQLAEMPDSPLAQNLLWLDRPATARRHHQMDLTQRAHLHHPAHRGAVLPPTRHTHRQARAAQQPAAKPESRPGDAETKTHPSPGPRIPNRIRACAQPRPLRRPPTTVLRGLHAKSLGRS